MFQPIKTIFAGATTSSLLLLIVSCSSTDMTSESRAKKPAAANVIVKDGVPVTADPTPTPAPDGKTPTPTPTASPTPSPTVDPLGNNSGGKTLIPPTAPQTLDFGSLWSAGDDGTYFYLNLDTGTWDWNGMNVYHPSYDHNVCQDYVGLIGTLNVIDASGKLTAAAVHMDWRFNPSCNQLPKNFQGNAVMPGTWGTFVNLDTATVTSTGGGGSMKVTQVGRTLRFDVYNSLGAVVKVTFKK